MADFYLYILVMTIFSPVQPHHFTAKRRAKRDSVQNPSTRFEQKLCVQKCVQHHNTAHDVVSMSVIVLMRFERYIVHSVFHTSECLKAEYRKSVSETCLEAGRTELYRCESYTKQFFKDLKCVCIFRNRLPRAHFANFLQVQKTSESQSILGCTWHMAWHIFQTQYTT